MAIALEEGKNYIIVVENVGDSSRVVLDGSWMEIVQGSYSVLVDMFAQMKKEDAINLLEAMHIQLIEDIGKQEDITEEGGDES